VQKRFLVCVVGERIAASVQEQQRAADAVLVRLEAQAVHDLGDVGSAAARWAANRPPKLIP
jgi:hypothetical protein